MSLDNFIETIYAANIEQALRKVLVAKAVANTQYDGQLKSLGDKVKIKQLSDVTVASYTPGTTSISPTALDSAALELVADKSYYFAFMKRDVDAVQSTAEIIRESSDNAAYGFADTADQALTGLYGSAGITSYAAGTTNWDVTSLNVEDVLLTTAEKMDDAYVPRIGRFIIMPPWFHTKLTLAKISGITDNVDVYNNGQVGRALGFDFYLSHNVSASSTTTWASTRLIAGVKGKSFAYADAIIKVEQYRVETDMADAVKGIYVFGVKMTRPDMTCTIYADKTAEPA